MEIRRMLHERYYVEKEKQEKLLSRKNVKSDFYNGVYDRYEYPVLTREHIPLTWRYDLNPETNPYFMERLGINAVMNSGAIELNGKYYLVARIEGNDRKSFFGVAESDNGIDGFRFWDYPILLPDTCPEETNVYDMRLTKHEDGYIYGVFCSESKDTTVNDLSAAVAAAGIVRTKDLKNWERLPNLVTLNSPQQRNVVLHPEFVDGKYAFYTRPMDGFIETGSGGGIGFGLCDDITHAVIDEERMTSLRKYHTITEAKNGAGATPIKTDRGWIHIAHGVRNTAAGLRYVIYAFATDLKDPAKVIAEPSGLLIGPRGDERVGDVSNVVFTNGAIANEKGEVFIYYASSDTRMHVATTTIDKLVDYVFHTPSDPGRSVECVAQRCELIRRNEEFLKQVRDLCDERDILLILDEIQCGMGRTGYMYAWQRFGVKPDIMTSAKALGCGVPVGAFMMTEKVAQHSLTAGDHGTTYGGNPLACAAVEKVLDLFEEDHIIEHVREVAPYLEQRLNELADKYDCIKERRGVGLMQGLVFEHPVGDIINRALEKGLILINAGADIIRFVPPLVITRENVDEMIAILDTCIE